MAFKSLNPYQPKIDDLLAKGLSPEAVAKAIGAPKKASTIRRYKAADFNRIGAAAAAWELERSKSHDERLEAGKATILDNFELINTAKHRAKFLLDLDIGDEYKTVDSEDVKQLTLGGAVTFWREGTAIMNTAIKLEMEIAGDDPESKKAQSLLGLINAVDRRRAAKTDK
jgi:hypothetical protein